MSTPDESTISFPVNMLKAETIRAIARDLHVPAGGKKEDVVQRMRTNSTSGWDTSTLTKRKADDAESSRPSTGPKRKARQSTGSKVNAVDSPAPASSSLGDVQGMAVESPGRKLRSRQSTRANANASSSPVRARNSRKKAQVDTETAAGPSQVGPVADADADGSPASDTEPAAKTNPSADGAPPSNGEPPVNGDEPPADGNQPSNGEPGLPPDAKSIADDDAVVGMLSSTPPKNPKFDDYFVTSTTTVFLTAGALHNLAAPTATSSALWKAAGSFANTTAALAQRVHFWLIPTVEGEIHNASEFKTMFGGALPSPGEGTWFEVSISRSESLGALNVKLARGEMMVPEGVVPLDASEPETGTFWVSNPRPASAPDASVLDQIIKPRV